MYKKILKIASVFGLLFVDSTLAGGFLPPPQQGQPQQIQTVTNTNTATTNQITQINNTNITNTTTITYVNNMPVNIFLDGTLYTTDQQQNGEEYEDNSGIGSGQIDGSGPTYGPGGYSGGDGSGYAIAYGEGGEVVFIQNEDAQDQEYSGAGVNNVQVVNEETLIQIVESLLIDAQAQENNIDVYNVENNVENIQNINSGNNITVVVIGTQNNIGEQIINPPPVPPAEEVETEEQNDDNTTSDTSDTSDSSDSDKECEENGGKGLKCGLKDAGEDIKDAFHDVKDGIKDAIGSLFHHD